ncbi:MAG: alpha/beta fold hydrolase [Leptospira sp.]|nr:alpha/beta fold hydrolase [Leptospira sp.]NCS95071.1 alpha/beta fold hydrolase [Leptospira sp.]
MKLNFKFYPYESDPNSEDKAIPNIVILHGLFASSKNWVSVAKQLNQVANVYTLDLRNHGDSPHSDTHKLTDMVGDLAEFLSNHDIKNPILLGHSMGGLVVMLYALSNPSIPIDKIIIQDIAPKDYPFVYENEVEAMSLDFSKAKSRAEIDEKMKKIVPNTFIRQFLQMNLERNPDDGYFWKLNISAISHSRKMFEMEFKSLQDHKSNVPSLFILGGDSEYIESEDINLIYKFFPNSTIEKIPGGGHYIQFTHNEEFLKILLTFLRS